MKLHEVLMVVVLVVYGKEAEEVVEEGTGCS